MIQDFFREAAKSVTFAVHYLVQPEIVVAEDGESASASWYLWQACTIDDTPMWLSALEYDKYKKINGRWWQTEMVLKPFFLSPYAEGWHKLQSE